MECKNSALCLFDEQDVQTDIIGNSCVDYHPTTSLTSGGPIEFFVPGSTDEYIDLSDINLEVIVKLTKVKAGVSSAVVDADKVAFINQPISSLFQDVFMSIGDKQVEGGQHAYPYNGYLSSLLQFHPSAKKTHMQAWGWNEDEPEKMNDENNEGFKFRSKASTDAKQWQLYGPLFLNMTRQSRYLLPQTDLTFKLLRSKAAFVIHQLAKPTSEFKIDFVKCTLWVRRVKVNNSVIAGHSSGLEKHNAIYPVQHVDLKTFTITSGTHSTVRDRLYMSHCPKLLVVGLLDHEAFNGKLELNPFNFEHFNLNKIAIYRDGELIPGQSFTPNFSDKQYARTYANTMSSLNLFNTDDSNGLTMEHFENGYNLYVFNLSPDATTGSTHRSPLQFANLRLEMNFAKALTKAVNVLLFAVFDAKVEITKLRDVLVSYER